MSQSVISNQLVFDFGHMEGKYLSFFIVDKKETDNQVNNSRREKKKNPN